MINRRLLLAGAASLPLAGCTTAQIAQFQQQWSNFVDNVNAILSRGCGLVPGFIATANTIEAVVAAFYPTAAMAISAGAAAVQAVAGAICNVVPSSPPAALAAKLHRARLRAVPTIVGNINVNGRVIPITGYGVR